MQTRRQSQLALAQFRKLKRLRRRAAAGAPGYRHEEGTQGAGHAVETCAQVGGAHGGFGGEEFEGEEVRSGWEGGYFCCDLLHLCSRKRS
jgi:hypothetical protein